MKIFVLYYAVLDNFSRLNGLHIKLNMKNIQISLNNQEIYQDYGYFLPVYLKCVKIRPSVSKQNVKGGIRDAADFQFRQLIYLLFYCCHMGKIQYLVILSLIFALSVSQAVNLSQIFTPKTIQTLGAEYSDPSFIKLIDNYFGCKNWTDGNCVECSSGYVFNNNGICCEVDQECQVFNSDVGICETCYTGYTVNPNGGCYPTQITADNVGCAKWQINTCVKCSVRYFFDAQNICTRVDDNCRDWDKSGACTSCYYGYGVVDGACVFNHSLITPNADANPLCAKWEGSVCVACAQRTFNNNGICQAVSDYCNTWDKFYGSCLSCYVGYDLVNGTCVFSQSNNALPTDAGCKTWSHGVCKECSSYWVFNANDVCIPVSDLCKTYIPSNGECENCYAGYDLINGSCLYSESNNAKPTDGGCRAWDLVHNKCTSCSVNWVFDDNGICIPVSDQCKTSNQKGLCDSCYRGYDLVNGSCVYSSSNSAALPDAGCKIWNWTANACEVCSERWVLAKTGFCVQVSDLCDTYSSTTGLCSSCYSGYDLVNGTCIYSPSNNAAPTDAGCKTWSKGVCKECSDFWVFNANGKCITVSDQCKFYIPSTGECEGCYFGYELTNGSCLYSESNNAKPTGGCKTWDYVNFKCAACSANWVFDSNGICVAVSDQCRTSDAQGLCDSCYRGYDLVNGSCVYSSSNDAALPDAGCKIWNWTANACDVCSSSWYFVNGICVQSSALCKSFDSTTGHCLSCYLGYDLVDGTCQVSASDVAPPTDPGCNLWDNGVCKACSSHWAFNSNNVCTPVSDQCKTSEGLACTSCYNGYVLVNGSCVLSTENPVFTDAGCAKWNWSTQTCLACSNNWFFSYGVCIPVSDQCKTHDSSNGECLSCYKGYDLNNGTCVVSTKNGKPTDPGCADWDWDNQVCLSCSKYYVLINGVCQSVSPFCKTNDATGACTSCFGGYSLNNGVCSINNSQCKTQNNGACLTCYNGFALYQGQCVQLSNLANIALYYAACCPEKLAKLQAEGRIPI